MQTVQILSQSVLGNLSLSSCTCSTRRLCTVTWFVKYFCMSRWQARSGVYEAVIVLALRVIASVLHDVLVRRSQHGCVKYIIATTTWQIIAIGYGCSNKLILMWTPRGNRSWITRKAWFRENDVPMRYKAWRYRCSPPLQLPSTVSELWVRPPCTKTHWHQNSQTIRPL